jgi:hypothetical protein
MYCLLLQFATNRRQTAAQSAARSPHTYGEATHLVGHIQLDKDIWFQGGVFSLDGNQWRRLALYMRTDLWRSVQDLRMTSHTF